MNLPILISLLSFLLLSFPSQGSAWSYENDSGPAHWGMLDKSFATCQMGTEQSPVPFLSKFSVNTKGLVLSYPVNSWAAEDNGHTIQFNAKPGNWVSFLKRKFELVQFHFHAPSEHTIDGKQFPLELHFVHKDQNGRLLVIGVFVEMGTSSPAVGQVFDVVAQGKFEGALANFDATELIPNNKDYYLYRGSLTTPPCSEGVTWVVMRTPIFASPKDIAAFTSIYPNNSRPVQAFSRGVLQL